MAKRAGEFLKRHWKVVAIATVSFALVIWFLNWMFSSPYTVVNAGDGKVYKVNRRTGESWLLTGSTEIPVGGPSFYTSSPESQEETRQQTALQKAQNSFVFRDAVPNYRTSFLTNEGLIQQELERDHQVDIRGWKSQKVDDDTYLVSCTFTDPTGKERGYYFEVQLNTGTVRNIFGRTGLHQRYAKFGVNPTYAIGPDNRTPVYAWWQKYPVVGSSEATGKTMTEEEFWKRGTSEATDTTNKTINNWDELLADEPQAENSKQSTGEPLQGSPREKE